jgi:hypothetical protein
MAIHVIRNTVRLGVCSSEEVAEGLRSGRFVAGDLAWREGMVAWTPLGEWTEFRDMGSTLPAGSSVSAPPPIGPPLPWEEAKGISSAFVTLGLVLRRPDDVLAGARLSFASTLLLAWTLLLAASVFSIAGGYLHAEQLAEAMKQSGAQVMEVAEKMQGPLRVLFAELGGYLADTPPKSFLQLSGQVLLTVAAAPVMYLLLGVIQWFGLRLLGLCGMKSCRTPAFGRTLVAGLLGHAFFSASYAPLALLTPNGLAYNFGLQACTVLGAVLYCRALGGALRVNPWAVFLSAVLFYGATAFCCCALFGVIIGFLAW